MTATERKAISASDTDMARQMPGAHQRNDALAGVSREAGQAAADAWTIWMTACQDIIAQQLGLMGQMLDRVARVPLDPLPASRDAEIGRARSIRMARENCQRIIQSMRASNDAALGWYFDMADRAAGQFARQLSAPAPAANGASSTAHGRAH